MNSGDTCYIVGLENRTDLNGRKVTLLEYDGTNDRWSVSISEEIGGGVKIRSINLSTNHVSDDLARTQDTLHNNPDEIKAYKSALQLQEKYIEQARANNLAKIQEVGLAKTKALARKYSIKNNEVYACLLCGAHRSMGYKCCGRYAGMNGASPVTRRNIHEHSDADDDEVKDFLLSKLAALDNQ